MEEFERVVLELGEDELDEGLVASVLDAYQEYDRSFNGGPPCGPIALSAVGREALVLAYARLGTRVRLRPLRDLLLALADDLDGLCPYCGIDQASTLDHFAAKSRYAEFAVYPYNLVASCPRCNHLKGESTADWVASIPFGHPYYESGLIASALLECDISYPLGVPVASFRLVEVPGGSAPDFRRATRQFTRLRLDRRLAAASQRELVGFSQSCRLLSRHVGAAAVAESCRASAESYSRAFGPNYWAVALYRALGESDLFVGGAFDALSQGTAFSEVGVVTE